MMTTKRGVQTEFGEWLAGQLRERGWGPMEASRQLGVPPSSISMYTNTVQHPGPDKAKRIADGLGFTFAQVWELVRRSKEAAQGPDLGEATKGHYEAPQPEMLPDLRAFIERLDRQAQANLLEAITLMGSMFEGEQKEWNKHRGGRNSKKRSAAAVKDGE